MNNNNKVLEWFFKFGQVDFAKLDQRERQREAIVLDAILIAHGFDLISDTDLNERLESQEESRLSFDLNTLEYAHQRIKELVKGLLISIGLAEGRCSSGLDSIEYFRTQHVETINTEVDIICEVEGFDMYNMPLPPNNFKDRKICVRYGVKEGAANLPMLNFKFHQSLDGVSVGQIKKCTVCDRVFLQLTKREKKYCGKKCLKNATMRKFRKNQKKNDPEKYEKEKKNAALRARKSYVERVQCGNPKTIVGRNPYKYKDLEED